MLPDLRQQNVCCHSSDMLYAVCGISNSSHTTATSIRPKCRNIETLSIARFIYLFSQNFNRKRSISFAVMMKHCQIHSECVNKLAEPIYTEIRPPNQRFGGEILRYHSRFTDSGREEEFSIRDEISFHFAINFSLTPSWAPSRTEYCRKCCGYKSGTKSICDRESDFHVVPKSRNQSISYVSCCHMQSIASQKCAHIRANVLWITLSLAHAHIRLHFACIAESFAQRNWRSEKKNNIRFYSSQNIFSNRSSFLCEHEEFVYIHKQRVQTTAELQI